MLYWLLDEVKHLSLAAIAEFQQHATWKFQYFAAFEFTHSEGYEAYDNLFGPNLIQPIEKFLAENPCVPTDDGGLAKHSEVVHSSEEPIAVKAIVELKLVQRENIASVFGGKAGLKLTAIGRCRRDQTEHENENAFLHRTTDEEFGTGRARGRSARRVRSSCAWFPGGPAPSQRSHQ